MRFRKNDKLSSRFKAWYEVTVKIGKVVLAKVHDAFHISQIKCVYS